MKILMIIDKRREEFLNKNDVSRTVIIFRKR